MNEYPACARKYAAIRDLMAFSVPANAMDEALDLLELYRDDPIGLDLLHEFYSALPDPGQPWVRHVRLLARQQGLFLLAVQTSGDAFIYLVSSEGVSSQGNAEAAALDLDLLDFFGFASAEDFGRDAEALHRYPEYEPLGGDAEVCPGCHASTGELHELGCPVEVCPWCGGQLISCACRFDRLGVDFLRSEEDLLRLETLLREQGRIPYAPEQRPAYPFVEDGGVDF